MEKPRTAEAKARLLDPALLSFEADRQLQSLKEESGWMNGDRNAITMVKTDKLRVTLLALRKGASMHEHQVKGPITLFVLEGTIRFVVGKDACTLAQQGFLSLDKAIPHDVEALTDAAFVLTIVEV